MTRKEQQALQCYRRLVGLTDEDYRAMMPEGSSKNLKRKGYRAVMASLVAQAWSMVDAGAIPEDKVRHPRGSFASELGTKVGEATDDQVRRILLLWGLLVDYLPPAKQSQKYLAAIAAQTGRQRRIPMTSEDQIEWGKVQTDTASALINALQSRLKPYGKESAA